MNDYDIYYVDGRNADHRTVQHAPPGRVVVAGQQPGHVRTVIQATQPYGQSPYGQVPMCGPQGPGYFGPQGPLGSSVLGRISTGQLIDMVAQIFVALMPLPAAPVATNDTSTDVNNLTLYQSSLA